MFHKVLIANRGEIAVRIIRACRELGLGTVAICSEADRMALHSQLADETICVGEAAVAKSYMDINSILSACLASGAGAIHPGFGFLSENAEFARACKRCGIKFIGPDPETIELMGDKARAKQVMISGDVSVIPGSEGTVETVSKAEKYAEEIGYPILIKARSGGGGRGIHKVSAREDLKDHFAAAQNEAQKFFGDNGVYIEKFIENPRHIEIQIMADEYGNVVHLGERECSLQRRNQKVLEECPSPSKLMTSELRERMGAAAAAAARKVAYKGAGTIEFLLDENGEFYFMEMNTRIQVEHGITEAVTGLDLIKLQIKVAMGETLGFAQSDVTMRGHAIECRINAETPGLDFRPSPGKIKQLLVPGGPGIRIDGAIYQGYTISPYYDNMIAKLISHAPTREESIARMKCALTEFVIEGVDSNIDFQLEILDSTDFANGEYNISWIGERLIGA